jgi:hypothetical protein
VLELHAAWCEKRFVSAARETSRSKCIAHAGEGQSIAGAMPLS